MWVLLAYRILTLLTLPDLHCFCTPVLLIVLDMQRGTLLLGDSLLRYVPENDKFVKLFFPGIDCVSLSEKISLGELDSHLGVVSLVILLVGTNDVPLSFPDRVANRILSVALALKSRYRTLTVAIAGVLPRPGDNGLYTIATKLCNKRLEAVAVGADVVLLRSYRPFLSFDEPRLSHFEGDGLHLSDAGVRALYRGFLSAIHRHTSGRLH